MPHVTVREGAAGAVPILSWARDLPKGSLAQLELVATQPWAAERVAAMPDAHVAEGVSVGTVFAAAAALVPAALGGDLGCGVAGARFDFPAAALSREQLEALLAALARRFPSGEEGHRGKGAAAPDALWAPPLSTGALERARERLLPRHLGTLGGGNHFIELDRDAAGDLWALVHSGSRGLGGAIGAHHVKAAQGRAPGPLPALSVDSPEGQAFLGDLAWALAFARANRDRLLEGTAQALASTRLWRSTASARSGSTGKAPSPRRPASGPSSPVRWGRPPISSRGSERRGRSAPPPTARAEC